MRLLLEESQQLLAKSARDFVESTTPVARLRELRDAGDSIGFSREIWSQMAELGWQGICLPEEHGGSGLGFADLVVVLEAAGRRLMPEPMLSTVLLGAQVLLLGDSAALRDPWLPRVASGDAILAVAYEETTGRFEPSRVEARAESTDGGFRLHGRKLHVLDASAADAIIVSARAADGVGLFVVDPSTAGVTVKPLRRVDARGAAHVELNGVRVADDQRVDRGGRGGRGLEILEQALDRGRIGLSAEMLGAAGQVFDDTLEYLQSRSQFGVKIGTFQALQHRAAKLYVELELARSAVLAAARTVDEDPAGVPKMACLAKARCSDAFVHVANEGIQMHGGIGVTDDYHLGFYLKRARVADVTFGDAAWHRKRWATLQGY